MLRKIHLQNDSAVYQSSIAGLRVTVFNRTHLIQVHLSEIPDERCHWHEVQKAKYRQSMFFFSCSYHQYRTVVFLLIFFDRLINVPFELVSRI